MTEYFSFSLHFAAKRDDVEALESLLKKWRDLDVVDMKGRTALHYACERGFLRIAKLLLDNGASVYSAVISTGETALHIAASKGDEDIVALLLKNGDDVHAVDKRGYTALLYAAQTSSENTVKQLVSHGADISAVSADGQTALSLACFSGRSSHVANFLIGCGANVHWAGTDHFSRGYTMLHDASRTGMIETIQLLLDMKVDVDAETVSGRTALHVACTWQQLNAVECLLQNGAQVSYPNRSGFTALHHALEEYSSIDMVSKQIVELLLEYGADVNAENVDGSTPLEIALKDSCTEMAKFFVKQVMNMKSQGSLVSENNLKAIYENKEANNFSACCEEEIDRMRKSTIGDSSFKISDIFTRGENRLADFASNEDVKRVLQSENYKAEFPVYAGEICLKFLQGRERRDLLRQSSDWLWAVISEFYELPYVCVQKINRYLANTDLALQISHDPSQQESVSSQL